MGERIQQGRPLLYHASHDRHWFLCWALLLVTGSLKTSNCYALMSNIPSMATPTLKSWPSDEYKEEARVAATLVSQAVRSCCQVQDSLLTKSNEDNLQSQKVDGTTVTVTDFAIQAYISARLEQIFPEDSILGEEDASMLRDDVRFMCPRPKTRPFDDDLGNRKS